MFQRKLLLEMDTKFVDDRGETQVNELYCSYKSLVKPSAEFVNLGIPVVINEFRVNFF